SVPRFLVEDQLQRRARLVPARVVIELRDLVEAKRQVVVRADPVRRVNHATFQRGKDFTTGQVHGAGTKTLQYLTGKTGHANLQASEILDAVDFLVVPAGQLGAGIAAGKRLQVEARVQFIPQLLAAAMVQPAILFLRGKAERYSGKERRGRMLAFPVVGGAMTQLGAAL